MSFASASANPERTPEQAVAGLRALLALLSAGFSAAFGAPSALAVLGGKGGVYGKLRERALRWLLDMECVVRRLLLLRAALFPAPAARTFSPGMARVLRRRQEGDAQTLYGPAEDSAQWRVHFRMPAPPEPSRMLGGFQAPEDVYELGHRVDHRAGTGIDSGLARAMSRTAGFYWVDDPRPLAERFEALLRVIADPDHYAARLAQRLYFWRGRMERRAIFLQSLCAVAPIANEAALSDDEWQSFAEARPITQALLPVFDETLPAAVRVAAPEPALSAPSQTPPETLPAPEDGAKPAPIPQAKPKSDFDALTDEIAARLEAIRESLADTS